MMHSIEQAVFTSAETDRSAGYQVVTASQGVGRDDLGELAVWGPSHDALLNPSPGASSLNFHPLPSGCYCVSRTTAAGWEYSGRGARIYTQCLIVPPAALARFAYNPFAIMRAAMAGGAICVHDEIPDHLDPIPLPGNTAAVDQGLLARLAANPGPECMAALVDAALASVSVAIAGTMSADHLVAGLLNCLPPECRTEFSFTTGLKFSSRRPFRIVAVGANSEEQHRVRRLYNATVLDFSADSPLDWTITDSWAQYIRRALLSGRTSLLADQLAGRSDGIKIEELSALGMELLEELDLKLGSLPAGASMAPTSSHDESRAGETENSRSGHSRAHRAHCRTEKSIQNAAPQRVGPPGPSTYLEPADRGTLDALCKLDSLVYEAITGPSESLEAVRAAWRQLECQLDAPLATRWREEYLRYALTIWTQSIRSDGVRNPGQAVRSLDVVCSLLDEPGTPPPA